MKQDIRWEQRFSNYRKALQKLNIAISVIEENSTDDKGREENKNNIEEILKEGLIQRFEYTHELAWNVMKDYAEYQGNNAITGSRDATREAFKMGLIANADGWMDMLKSRNLTSHTYNSETAEEIHKSILNLYAGLFKTFVDKMESLRSGPQTDIFKTQ